jgi:hypothetical protein
VGTNGQENQQCVCHASRVLNVLNAFFRYQAEHLNFPLQAKPEGKVSNLELTAKFKVTHLTVHLTHLNLSHNFQANDETRELHRQTSQLRSLT